MFRLRTTTGLSLLALAVGVAGTFWLSEQTANWTGPARRVAHATRAPSTEPAKRRMTSPARAPAPRVAHLPPIENAQAATVPVESATVALTPIDMPAASADFFSRRTARAGRVVLSLTVDGQGRVIHAGVGESSGDPQLDDEAVRTVQHWRFAVPADHPDGISGMLPMRFDANNGASSGS
ncbi:protein TonB [Dyella sp. OK004]|uniref:energy transducer TonB family protein n=1 Tax=Dyella sp. OK004 TaxID=1855292 RepID=UPI0008E8DDEA|nr:energy transducer TonB [Dyella sp. OK004]SFR96085.1 protein TonB [Dyella sp. OK004]